MKKEYLLLAAVILGLCLYLFLKTEDQTHYTLPKIQPVEPSQVDRLIISKADETLEFQKTADGWVVGKEQFPADTFAVDSMLDVVKNLKISALVSEKQDRFRYELDQTHALDVKVFKEDRSLMAFTIGKTAPSFNHTFVMLDADTRIYHAQESFRSKFDKSLDDFRDKTVLAFDEKSIGKIKLDKGGKTGTLTASKTEDKEKEPRIIWQYEDGSSPDKEAVTGLLSSLSSLACSAYLPKEEKSPSPTCTVILENEKEMVLHLYDRKGDGRIDGRSSMNEYPFTLASYTAKDILAHVDTLLGLEEKPDPESKE